MIKDYWLIVFFFGTALTLSGCSWINAAGKAYEGAGEGLEEASAEETEGSFNQRMFKLGGVLGKAVGKALQKGSERDVEVTATRTGTTAGANREMIRGIQQGLFELGFLEVKPDGVLGEQTRTAIMAYQRQHALLVDGRASNALWKHIDSKAY